MLKIAICDDESLFCNQLKQMIEQYMNKKGVICEIQYFSSGIEFVNQGRKMTEYRIIFLDINMANLNGIETAIKVREFCEDTLIVFTTAYINYVLDGYKVNAFRYLLKNSENFGDAFEECMNNIINKIQIIPKQMEFDFMGGKRNVYLDRIMYIESNLHKVIFHIVVEGERIPFSINKETLNHIEQKINDDSFIRIHQSFLVNLSFVRRIDRQMIVLTDSTGLPISKSKYKKVVESITIYKGAF